MQQTRSKRSGRADLDLATVHARGKNVCKMHFKAKWFFKNWKTFHVWWNNTYNFNNIFGSFGNFLILNVWVSQLYLSTLQFLLLLLRKSIFQAISYYYTIVQESFNGLIIFADCKIWHYKVKFTEQVNKFCGFARNCATPKFI